MIFAANCHTDSPQCNHAVLSIVLYHDPKFKTQLIAHALSLLMYVLAQTTSSDWNGIQN